MAEIVYEYPKERTYIYCGKRNQRIDTELCGICKRRKRCRDIANHVKKVAATKLGGK